VCRCIVASGLALVLEFGSAFGPGESEIWVSCAVRSCEALAMMCVESSEGEGDVEREGTTQMQVMGAGWARLSVMRFCE